MQVQINTDSNIAGNDRLAQQVEAVMRNAFGSVQHADHTGGGLPQRPE